MFRAAHRSSSGALNCTCSRWFIYCNKVKDVVYIIVADHFIQSFIGLLAPVSYSLITQVQEPLAIGRGGV
jgi:hypothetical protein